MKGRNYSCQRNHHPHGTGFSFLGWQGFQRAHQASQIAAFNELVNETRRFVVEKRIPQLHNARLTLEQLNAVDQ
jgi:hypothetical protein